MPHETGLIVTLVAGFGLAFAFGLAAVRLRLPPLVGYLMAGVMLGPFAPGPVVDGDLASQLAEVGVVLLMFGVGLHFSIKDLLAVRRIALPGALLRIIVITAISAGLAQLWGWGWGAGILLGLALSVASTVVVLRALEGLGVLDTADGRIAVGWLIVEDFAMVLALVLLPPLAGAMGGTTVTVAGAGSLGAQLALTLLKVSAFVALMLFVGTRAVPWLLQRVARTGSRELFTLAVLAVALGIAFGAASLFGVSFALGAFSAGVVISESDLSHQAAADALPLQDAFAVLFFVSVGMLFDFTVLLEEPLRVVLVVLIVVVAKFLVTFAIAHAYRRPLRSSLLISASLAQIGEFSFIIAALGIALGVLPEDGRDLILAGAILSITLNPLVFRLADAVGTSIQSRPQLAARMERHEEIVELPPPMPALRDHVVLIGYGRVGRRIGDALEHEQIPFIAVERDRVAVEALRQRGVPALYGDAARPGILEHVHMDTARLLVIASPDPYQARRVIEIAQALHPDIEIAARTHSETGQAYLEKLGVARAFMGERELALSMAHHTLMRMGRSDDEADAAVHAMRRATMLGIKAVVRPG